MFSFSSIRNPIGLILAAIACVLFWVYTLPSYNNYNLIKFAVAEREALLNKRGEQLSVIKTAISQTQVNSEDILKSYQLVPSKKQAPELIVTLNDIATKTGVIISNFNFGDIGEIPGNSLYSRLSISISMFGSFDSLLNFLNAVETNLRIIDIISLNIGGNESSGGENTLNITLSGYTYVAKTIDHKQN
jgi:Tfp pilus assembly protein PilO